MNDWDMTGPETKTVSKLDFYVCPTCGGILEFHENIFASDSRKLGRVARCVKCSRDFKFREVLEFEEIKP